MPGHCDPFIVSSLDVLVSLVVLICSEIAVILVGYDCLPTTSLCSRSQLEQNEVERDHCCELLHTSVMAV